MKIKNPFAKSNGQILEIKNPFAKLNQLKNKKSRHLNHTDNFFKSN